MYSADVAQDDYGFEATRKGPNPKIGNNHVAANFIDNLIACVSYSPYAASVALRNEESLGLTLSFKTIYNYIERGFFASLTKKDLPRKGKRSRRQYKGVRRTKRDSLAKSIHDRPKAANNRSELGHWERDYVESGKNIGPLY